MTKRKSKAFFDRIADKGLWHKFEPEEMSVARRFIGMWDIAPGSRVLEPGCGCGRLTELLARSVGRGGKLVAVDISPAMIAAAAARGLPSQVELVEGCLSDIAPARYSFEHVICCNVWPHLIQIDGILDHIASLLEFDGHFWISHLCGREKINHIHRNAGDEVSDHILAAARELSAVVSEHGFSIVDYADEDDIYWIHAQRTD